MEKGFHGTQTDGWVDGSPAIAYGYVYVGNSDWNLYCFTDGPARKINRTDPTGTIPLLAPQRSRERFPLPQLK